jgi:tetratricopeptide (TPR) repeat protein
VFWVHASNAARLEQGYRDIADQVMLAGRNDPQADVFKLVSNWLRNEHNGKWLLVLDNADDATVLSPPLSSRNDASLHRLSTSLPPSKYGSVLVTSRTKHAASQLVEESDIISIEPMHNAAAQTLLHKKLGDEVNKDGITELAVALEFMPLALVQAAAYIRQRAPRCLVRQYLEDFHKSDIEKTSLLNQEAGRLRRDYEAKNSVITTWQISFDHIRQIRPSATDLLSLMSFFDRQGIPQFLLNKPRSLALTLSKLIQKPSTVLGILKSSRRNKDASKEDNASAFKHDILTLTNYSFVTVSKDGATFEMHALVQLATRRWLKLHGYLEIWKRQYIKNLYTVFPDPNHENWKACRTLFPHVKSAEAHKPTAKHSLQRWVSMLFKAATYAEDIGEYAEAERMYTSVIRVEREMLGAEHPDTLISMNNLASTYWSQGRWKEAEELEVQVIETRKRVLGPEHPNTLTSINNLASTYWNQGRLKEAEELEVQVMEVRKRVLGLEHPDTLTSMNNLASTYWNQGRLKEAEELEVQAIETRKRVLGLEHPNTLTSMNNLALTYWNQGRWKEAEELGVQVIETRKRVLGPEHPNTLTSINNLASTYRNQGRLKEAEELEVQVMEARKRVLGLEHPDTLTSMSNLALTY